MSNQLTNLNKVSVDTLKEFIPPKYLKIKNGNKDYQMTYDSLMVSYTSHTDYGKIGKPREVQLGAGWIFIVIVFTFFVYASVCISFREYLRNVVYSLLNNNNAKHLYRENGYKVIHGAIRLDLIVWISLSLFATQMANFYRIRVFDFHGFYIFLFFLVFFLLLSTGRIHILKIIGYIINKKEEVSEMIFCNKLYFRFMGIVLLPLITCLTFVSYMKHQLFIFSFIFICLMIIGAILNGAYLLAQKHFSIFYLILYLCTLEILPILLIGKLLVS